MSNAKLPNRIRELREAKGLSAEELGKLVGTTGTTIRRLETGSRRLTDRWMLKIAPKLGVQPPDLIATAQMADLKNEVKHTEPPEMRGIARALASRNMAFYRVLEPSLCDIGIEVGQVKLADHSAEALSNIKTGDVVVVELRRKGKNNARVLALRIFIAPDMLITNHPNTNLALKFADPHISSRIVAVVVQDNDGDISHH